MRKRMRKWIKVFAICTILVTSVKMGGSYEISASTNTENTETNKVPVDSSVAIAETQQYKDMEYGFLSDLPYGLDKAEKASVVFDTVEDMMTSTNEQLSKEGNIVRTEGYVVKGDGGAACYQISATKKNGSIELANKMYANIIEQSYKDSEGHTWLVVNVHQFGAIGDGKHEDHIGINCAIGFAGSTVKDSAEYDRGIVYIPKGEYKCADQLFADTANLNIVGEGTDTVIFTDNDYRDKEGYSEHFWQITGAKNMFFGMFKVEAREVDLYHYMRQFTLIDSDQVYVYQVELNVPQESYSSYYFEDKQYSNFCCYSGNSNVTVDDCKMIQLSGTYRGANLGVLDIWAKGEENITIMNCELYGNARDEQIGFFSRDLDSAYVKNVNFINNTIHSSQLKYTDIIGTRTMCFTIGYTDSKNIENIRVAGNHFICETDSKFMTFGAVKNCVIENNIIEIVASNGQMGMVFDSSNSDAKNIIVRNNEFFMTGKRADKSQGKQDVIAGRLTFVKNRFFSDAPLAFHFAYKECVAEENDIIFLKKIGDLAAGCYEFNRNTVNLYGGLDYWSTHSGADSNLSINFNGNTIYDYRRYIGKRADFGGVWSALNKITCLDAKSYNYTENQYYCPNIKFTGIDHKTGEGELQRLVYVNPGPEGSTATTTLNFSNNMLQGVKGMTMCGSDPNMKFVENNNKILEFSADEQVEPCTRAELIKDRKKVIEITVFEDAIDLSCVLYVAKQKDEEGKIVSEEVDKDKEVRWYTSVEGIATVSEEGVVKKKMNGDVKVYAVPLDGSGIYAECLIHFEDKKAEKLQFAKDKITLQPNLKYYMDYQVLPLGTSQDLVWTSADETIATIDKDGMITAKAKGTTVITGTTLDGSNLKQTIEVTVEELTVKKITLSEKYSCYQYNEIGQQKQLAVKEYIPAEAVNRSIKYWESTDPEVVKVDQNGLVTVVGPGKATVYAYSTDEYCRGYSVFVVQNPAVSELKYSNITNEAITLTWKSEKKAEGYKIYSRMENSSEWEEIADVADKHDEEQVQYTLTKLKENTNYKLCVRAYNYRWITTGKEYIESDDSIVSVKTLSYVPITNMKTSNQFMCIRKGAVSDDILTYGPATANYPNLSISYSFGKSGIVEMTKMDKSGSKRGFQLKGLEYGITDVTFSSNDDWGVQLTIPVGVVCEKMVPQSTVSVEEENGKAVVKFAGFENEKELLASGAITGYMVLRSQSVVLWQKQYIPADGSGTYTFIDDTVNAGGSYTYSIAPCITDGTNYFHGYDNGRYGITMEGVNIATNVQPSQALYTVPLGGNVVVSAKILPDEVSSNVLSWKSDNEQIATVVRKESEKVTGDDYATVWGKAVGATTLHMETTDGSCLSATSTIVVVPGKIKNLIGTKTNTSITLVWDKVEDATGYKVYRYDDVNRKWILKDTTNTDIFTDKELEVNKTYRYKVIGYYRYNGVEYEGEESSEISIKTNNTLLDKNPGSSIDVTSDGAIEGEITDVTDTKNNISIVGYQGIYDGIMHPAVTVGGILPTDRVFYSADQFMWTEKTPSVTNVSDSKKIFVRIVRAGNFYDYVVDCIVKPKSIAGLGIEIANHTVSWSGQTYVPEILYAQGITSEDCTVQYDATKTDVGLYEVILNGIGNYCGTISLPYTIELDKGKVYTVNGYKYKYLGNNKVQVTGTTKPKKNIVIKDIVILGGSRVCKVTSIGASAFKGNKKVTSVSIGKNVSKIGKWAFANDKKLKKVVFTGTQIVKMDKTAWKKNSTEIKFYIPKVAKKRYRKLLPAYAICKIRK